MFLSFSYEVKIKCNHDCRNYKNDDNFSFLNELLFDVEETQIRNKDKMNEFNNIIKHLA